MFDYPLPPLHGGLYAQLQVSPEATAEEINGARQGYISQLKFDQKKVRQQLEFIYANVPGLKDVLEQVEALLQSGESGDPIVLRAAQARAAVHEEEADSAHPEFRDLREKLNRLELDIHEANVIAIQKPEDRREYDQSHPPFEILKLEDCFSSPLDDRRTMLAAVRSELSDFLEQAGESVFHPSDLSRGDFSGDFIFDPSLDRNQ